MDTSDFSDLVKLYHKLFFEQNKIEWEEIPNSHRYMMWKMEMEIKVPKDFCLIAVK